MDFANTFNSAWHPIVAPELKENGCPWNLYLALVDFMTDRWVHSGPLLWPMARGVGTFMCRARPLAHGYRTLGARSPGPGVDTLHQAYANDTGIATDCFLRFATIHA